MGKRGRKAGQPRPNPLSVSVCAQYQKAYGVHFGTGCSEGQMTRSDIRPISWTRGWVGS